MRTPFNPGPFANHLRRPALFEPRLGLHRIRKSPGTKSLGVALRLLMRLLGTVSPATRVPCQFPADTTRVTPQSPSHLPNAKAFLPPTVDEHTLLRCHALVGRLDLLVLSNTKTVAYQVTGSCNRCCDSRSPARIEFRYGCVTVTLSIVAVLALLVFPLATTRPT